MKFTVAMDRAYARGWSLAESRRLFPAEYEAQGRVESELPRSITTSGVMVPHVSEALLAEYEDQNERTAFYVGWIDGHLGRDVFRHGMADARAKQ